MHTGRSKSPRAARSRLPENEVTHTRSHAPVRRSTDLPAAAELRALLHLQLLEHGYSYARRGFIALSLPLGEPDIDGFATAVEAFLTEHAALVRETVVAA